MAIAPRFAARLCLAACCLTLGGGCATLRKRSAEKKAAKAAKAAALEASKPAPERPLFSGTIALVNEESRFVLIDGGYSGNPVEGAPLKSSRDGAETGALRVSAERRRPFVIADIVSGEPQKGDRVLQERAPKTAPPQQ